MESSSVIELKTVCVDIGIFCRTNPYRKTLNIDLGSPEINSHWRQREKHIKFYNLHKEDVAHKRLSMEGATNTMHNR